GDALALTRAHQHTGHVTSHADRAVAPGEHVHRERRVSSVGEAPRDFADVLVQTVHLVDHHDPWVGRAAIRQREESAPLQLAGRDFPRLHDYDWQPSKLVAVVRGRSGGGGILYLFIARDHPRVGPWRSWERVRLAV